ncbi:MAG: molybdenum cofactor guanylyltransferase [Actinobacteria bacterium]|nr:MAG: molybdenum cofactor guanylyltransferase [Actinomycetota bacterium]
MTGIILAGGQSSRLKNKCLLKLDDKTLIEIAANSLSSLCSEVLIVTKKPNDFDAIPGVRLVKEEEQKQGPLLGLSNGLANASNDYSFVVACDMPFLNADVLQLIAKESYGYDVCVPQVCGRLQPLHAVYHRNCLAMTNKAIKRGEYKVTSFYSEAKVNYVNEDKVNQLDPGLLSFFNINTVKDFLKAKTLWAKKQKS